MDKKQVIAESYTLTENGHWLGQVVLTSDGAFMAITDYGNFNFAWRYSGNFKEFICSLDTSYFAGKMIQGMSYVAYGRKIDKAAEKFSEKILPVLQQILKEELNSNK